MPRFFGLRNWWMKPETDQRYRCLLEVEGLEDRTVPAGTFGPPLLPAISSDPQPTADRMTLAVADLTGAGLNDVILGDALRSQVDVHLSQTNQDLVWGSSDGIVNPHDVATADLNGDGIPDLMIANTVSNTVSILLGQGTGANWTLASGPVLNVGQEPEYALAQDLNGDGLVDILVCCRQAHAIYQLNNLGGGSFDQDHPIIYPVTGAPGEVALGQFDDQPGMGMVSVEADGLTYFPHPTFTAPPTASIRITDGVPSPAAAVVGNFSQDGLSDLAVLNSNNGTVAFLLGSPQGLQLAATVAVPNMPNPTDMALAPDNQTLFVSGESTNQAVQVPLPAFTTGLPSEQPSNGPSVTPSSNDLTTTTGQRFDIMLQDVTVPTGLPTTSPLGKTESAPVTNPANARTTLQSLAPGRSAFVAIIEVGLPDSNNFTTEPGLIVRAIPADPSGRTYQAGDADASLAGRARTDGDLYHFMSGDEELLAQQLSAARQRLADDIGGGSQTSTHSILDTVSRAWLPALATTVGQVALLPSLWHETWTSAWRGHDWEKDLDCLLQEASARHPQPNDEVGTADLWAAEPILPAAKPSTSKTWPEVVGIACWIAGMHFCFGERRGRDGIGAKPQAAN